MGLPEAAIVTRLKSNSTVTGLIGSRIYPHTAPQNAVLPYVVYYATSTPEHYMGGRAGLLQCEMTLEVYAGDGQDDNAYAALREVVTAIRQSIDGFQASINVSTGGGNVQAVSVRTCLCESFADLEVPPIDGSARGRIGTLMQFSIGILESSSLGA